MAEVLTYDSLKADMKRYLEKGSADDLLVVEQIPRLINLAQRAISDQFKIQGMIQVVTSTLSAGVFSYAKPDRWRETVSMLYGTGAGGNIANPIFPRSYEYCRMYAPDVTVEGLPEYYADYNYEFWLIVPTPIATYPWEISYYELPPLLGDTVQTNWLTDYAPGALLYRALLEAAPFLKNDERIPTWKGLYDEAVQALDVQDIKKIVDRSSTREEA
jgi:hypothetical protein